MQMDEKEELKQELEQKLQWVRYRQKMLDSMEEKLLEMKQIAEKAKKGNLSLTDLETMNYRLNNLAEQIRAIDSKSRRTEDGRILE
jgi:uncharacterized protein (UPF0218 family)